MVKSAAQIPAKSATLGSSAEEFAVRTTDPPAEKK
jgi:hypothetical protein